MNDPYIGKYFKNKDDERNYIFLVLKKISNTHYICKIISNTDSKDVPYMWEIPDIWIRDCTNQVGESDIFMEKL